MIPYFSILGTWDYAWHIRHFQLQFQPQGGNEGCGLRLENPQPLVDKNQGDQWHLAIVEHSKAIDILGFKIWGRKKPLIIPVLVSTEPFQNP